MQLTPEWSKVSTMATTHGENIPNARQGTETGGDTISPFIHPADTTKKRYQRAPLTSINVVYINAIHSVPNVVPSSTKRDSRTMVLV